MPFTPFPTLDPNPVVRVFFSGLTISKPAADGRTCETFIHQIATGHALSIEIRVKRPNQRDVILARVNGPLQPVPLPGTGIMDHGFIIQTDEAAGIKGYNGAPTAEGHPLLGSQHLALDLNDLHPGKAAVHKPSGRPSIFMNDAIFYSADMTHPDLHIDLRQGNVTVRELTPFASLIGANIYNPAVVAWRQNGTVQTMKLNPLANGLSYEIYVINDPLFQPPVPLPAQPHDELDEYYKLLPGVPEIEQFNMFFTAIPDEFAPKTEGTKGSSRTPCMSVIDNGG